MKTGIRALICGTLAPAGLAAHPLSLPSNLTRPPTAPEFWQAETSSDSVLLLRIPSVLSRARVFDIDASVVVAVPDTVEHRGLPPWHELTLEVDGSRQWSRRVPSHNPGSTDGLDYHLRWRLEAGQSARVRAVVTCQGSRIRHLQIEARETLPD